MFYQKITDIYATTIDYDKSSKITQAFFKTVQNKLHFAAHRHTAPELIVERANANKPHMGLTNCANVSGLCRVAGEAEYPDDDGGLGGEAGRLLGV